MAECWRSPETEEWKCWESYGGSTGQSSGGLFDRSFDFSASNIANNFGDPMFWQLVGIVGALALVFVAVRVYNRRGGESIYVPSSRDDDDRDEW